MILLVGLPATGFTLGLLVRRWSVVAAAVFATIVFSAIGLPLGWFDSQDMQPLGGLIITLIYFAIPFLLFLGLGVRLGRQRWPSRHSVSR